MLDSLLQEYFNSFKSVKMSAGLPYLGSKISLISQSDVRYEGILYTIDTVANTVALAKIRSFGTEDRPTDRPMAPREEEYEYIIFRATDLKDIRVLEPPNPQATLQGGLASDPAIVKHSKGGPVAYPQETSEDHQKTIQVGRRTDLARIRSQVAVDILVDEVHLRLGKQLGFMEEEGGVREEV